MGHRIHIKLADVVSAIGSVIELRSELLPAANPNDAASVNVQASVKLGGKSNFVWKFDFSAAEGEFSKDFNFFDGEGHPVLTHENLMYDLMQHNVPFQVV